jgi:CRP/FNR family cyclic AMP-dependent transcriptional regulator
MPMMEPSRVLEKLSAFPIRVYEAGDVVIHESSTTERLWVLQHGVVDVVKDDVPLARVEEPGAVFGEMALILGRAHTANVLAVASSSFFVVDGAQAYLEAEPEMARYVLRVLAGRLDAANRFLIDARTAYLEAGQRHGVLDEMFSKIGRALHIGVHG